jgi:hypothetical protein
MDRISQSVAKRVVLKAFLASDHISAATGKTIAVVISKNGAAFANPSAGATNATAIGNGWYYVDLSTTDTGTAGPLIVRGTEGTIDDTEIAFSVEAPILTTTVTLVEPTAPPSVNCTVLEAQAWMLVSGRVGLNKLIQTEDTQTLRNNADNADIGERPITVVTGVSTTLGTVVP